MGTVPLFRRSRSVQPSPARAVEPPPIPDTDWADPEAVLAEWRNNTEPSDWGGAMQMFDEGPIPAQRLNVAEYLTRRLKYYLFDDNEMPDELAAEACRRALVLLSDVPLEPDFIADSHRQFGPKLIRLPLAIMRQHGWQPAEYGGDGTVAVDLKATPIREAVATTICPDGDYVRYFFSGEG